MSFLSISFFSVPAGDQTTKRKLKNEYQLIYNDIRAFMPVTVIHHHSDKTHHTEGHFHFFPGKNGFFRIPWKTLWFVAGIKPRVVLIHSFMEPLPVIALICLLPRNTRYIVQHHAEGPYSNFLKVWLQRRAFRRFNLYLFTSKQLGEPFVEKKIIDPENIKELMEIGTLVKPVSKKEARALLNIPFRKVLLWIGRLNTRKDPLTILSALEHISDIENWHLYMIFSENNLLPEVQHKIQSTALKNRVTLAGYVDHEKIYLWHSAADIFLAASHYEGSGIALCEAMACGVVPVVTNIPPFRFMTGEGKCGWLYSPGNADELSFVLKEVLNTDLSAKSELCRKQFETNLSHAAISAKLAQMTAELLT